MANPANISQDTTCGICNVPIGQSSFVGQVEDLVKLPCNHIFGDKCIDSWLKTEEYGYCPTCHVDCPKDFVDTWSLLRETVKAGESLGVKENGEATLTGGIGAENMDNEKPGNNDENVGSIEGIDESAVIEGRSESGDPDIEQPIMNEGNENVGSIDRRIEASAAEVLRAEPLLIDEQTADENIGNADETIVVEQRIEDLEPENLDAEQEANPDEIEEIIDTIDGDATIDSIDGDATSESRAASPKQAIQEAEEIKVPEHAEQLVNEEEAIAEDTEVEGPESVEHTSTMEKAAGDELEGLEIIVESSVEDETSGNEVEEIEGTDNVEGSAAAEVFTEDIEEVGAAGSVDENSNDDGAILNDLLDETEEIIDGTEGTVQDGIDEEVTDEDTTLVEKIGVADDVKDGTIAEEVSAEEGLAEKEVEEETIAVEAVGEEGGDEDKAEQEVAGNDAAGEANQEEVVEEQAAQEEVSEGNATGDAIGEDEGPAWGTAQEGPELLAVRSLHFFGTHGYGDQYRTELEAFRTAAGRSTRNMVSAFNTKAHPLPEGREQALVSKNIQVWAKYLHALKIKSLDELKTTKSRKFRVDIAGWYENQREDFFQRLDENLANSNPPRPSPDMDEVKLAEDSLKAGATELIAELDSILASLE